MVAGYRKDKFVISVIVFCRTSNCQGYSQFANSFLRTLRSDATHCILKIGPKNYVHFFSRRKHSSVSLACVAKQILQFWRKMKHRTGTTYEALSTSQHFPVWSGLQARFFPVFRVSYNDRAITQQTLMGTDPTS